MKAGPAADRSDPSNRWHKSRCASGCAPDRIAEIIITGSRIAIARQLEVGAHLVERLGVQETEALPLFAIAVRQLGIGDRTVHGDGPHDPVLLPIPTAAER